MAKFSRPEGTHDAIFLRGVDGDTVLLLVKIQYGIWIERPVRIMRIDSWEFGTADDGRAHEAAARLTAAFAMKPCTLRTHPRGLDCYGRFRGDVQINGEDIANWLVAAGLAWWRPHPAAEVKPPTPEETAEILAPQCPPLSEREPVR